jgi:hypothetical protein
MDRIDAIFLRQLDDPVDIQISADRLARMTDLISLVRLKAVQGKAILVGVDGHRTNVQFVGRAKNASGDFAAIGHQELLDRFHGRLSGGILHGNTGN